MKWDLNPGLWEPWPVTPADRAPHGVVVTPARGPLMPQVLQQLLAPGAVLCKLLLCPPYRPSRASLRSQVNIQRPAALSLSAHGDLGPLQ